jgi:hypothetical protein
MSKHDESHRNKPFMVGFDIAKMTGLLESDSRIALSTWLSRKNMKD